MEAPLALPNRGPAAGTPVGPYSADTPALIVRSGALELWSSGALRRPAGGVVTHAGCARQLPSDLETGL